MTPSFGREERAALLALAETDELVALADAVLAGGGRLEVVRAPTMGCVATQVVEPVGGERFLLGDVLACQAEVALDDVRGWAMRLGDERAATLAAAVCDAAAQSGAAGDVDALCYRVAAMQADREAQEWATLAPTVVEFQELR